MVHKPTGTVTTAEEHSMQAQNKKAAFTRMCEILVPLMRAAAKSEQETASSDERIRTYNEPESRVKDHRTGKTYRYQDILDGKLDEMISDIQEG
jgi:peptide chain release factor 1